MAELAQVPSALGQKAAAPSVVEGRVAAGKAVAAMVVAAMAVPPGEAVIAAEARQVAGAAVEAGCVVRLMAALETVEGIRDTAGASWAAEGLATALRAVGQLVGGVMVVGAAAAVATEVEVGGQVAAVAMAVEALVVAG